MLYFTHVWCCKSSCLLSLIGIFDYTFSLDALVCLEINLVGGYLARTIYFITHKQVVLD